MCVFIVFGFCWLTSSDVAIFNEHIGSGVRIDTVGVGGARSGVDNGQATGDKSIDIDWVDCIIPVAVQKASQRTTAKIGR